MIRRTNFTGRKSIRLADIDISLNKSGGLPFSFDAVFDLGSDKYDLDPSSIVYVEAYHRTAYMRFCFGTVGNLVEPKERKLFDLVGTEHILFRLKVLSPTRKGLILAEADKVRTVEPEEQKVNRAGILQILPEDLGQEAWSLDYTGDCPTLLVNSSNPFAKEIARTDPTFQALVFPVIIRMILMKILPDFDADDETSSWEGNWIKFATALVVSSLPENAENNSLTDEQIKWIDDVVDSFCKKFSLYDKYNASQQE